MNYTLFISFLFCFNILFSQIKLEKEYQIESDFFEVDNSGFIYIVKDNNISKFNSKFIKLAVFQSPDNKEISSIDVSNGFKISVFYKAQNSFIILDNTLSPIGEPVNLDTYENIDADVICTAVTGGIWLWASSQNKIAKLNAHYELDFERNLFDRASFKTLYMVDYSDNLFALSQDSIIYRFDRNGFFLDTLDVQNVQNIQVTDNYLVILSEKKLKILNLKNNNLEILDLPQNIDVLSIRKSKNKFYLTDKYKLYSAAR